ncbi:hypothetical protein [Kitasatospora cathayae]|uniref:Uncharacterized protein n=1 Tax=Kitasatospora cathayae TaxID=3004092 RepID=A0ABY7QFI0_9ACTN|nr:hypothetical protein [Kitasatospora sp. HUAS 3-15]WBP91316.1 hypothetical protein O1G21_39165 [Kitasatospora sp. HUAS 3-15]
MNPWGASSRGSPSAEYGPDGNEQWTRRPGGRCWPCHQAHTEHLEREAEEQLEAAREASAALRPCWTCRGSIGGKAGSELELELELTENAGPDRLECPQRAADREVKGLVFRSHEAKDAYENSPLADELRDEITGLLAEPPMRIAVHPYCVLPTDPV